MKKITFSSTRLSLDSAHSANRSFTPLNSLAPRVLTPSIQETQILRLIHTPKKYSILTVPQKSSIFTIPQKFSIFTEKKSQPNPLPANLASTQSSEIKISKQKSQKISLAKRKKIKRSYRSEHNPNEENLRAELQKLVEKPVQRPVLTENYKVEEKSDIEKLLESQSFERIYRKRKAPLYVQTQQALTEESEDLENEKKNDYLNFEWKESTNELGFESKTPIHMRKKKNSLVKDKSCYKSFSVKKNEFKTLDYKDQSWEILKSTAFLAEKIMKSIRNNAKIKYLCPY